MQEYGMSSMSLMRANVPFQWRRGREKKNGHQATDPIGPSGFWTGELEALQRAQRAHDQSLMMLVHELRSPASASKSMVATLRYLYPQDTQLVDFLSRIENRMDQLLDLVDGILDLSQAKAERSLGQAAVLDLVAETRAVCKPYLEDVTAKGLAMSVELSTSPVRVHMPERAYHLIVSNLISNAVKYTPAGSVWVTLRQEGAWAVLEVQDTGIGVPPGEIGRLCTEFFRASNARKSRTPGTGLGLAAVRALVESHNGELGLQSQENQGSRFRVRLPLCQPDAAQEVQFRQRVERKVQ